MDISSLTGDLLTVGMFVALDFVWDRAKADRTEEKAIFIDECWQLLSGAGAAGVRLAGDFLLEIAKTIRGYPGLNMQQLLCFHPGKEEIIKTLLSHLQKQSRIFQTDTGGYFPSGWAAKSDNSLIRAAWVLLDFIGQVEYHAPGDFPVKLIFFANGELYEIVYAASGQEALINHALRDDSSGGRRIILVDNPEDIRRIDCPGISGFCTVDAAGQVHYFKKTGGT